MYTYQNQKYTHNPPGITFFHQSESKPITSPVSYIIYTLYGFKGFKLFIFVLTYLFYYTFINQTIMLMCIKPQPYIIRV